MHFSPQRQRKDKSFQQMHSSVATMESLDFLDLEGLNEYSPGGKKHPTGEGTVTLKKRLQNLGIMSPRRKSMPKSAWTEKNLKSDTKSPNRKKATSERNLDTGTRPSPKKGSTKKSPVTPFPRKVAQEPVPRTPKTPLDKLRSVTPFRRRAYSVEKFEGSQDSFESLGIIDLNKMETTNEAEEKPGKLSTLKQTMAKTFSPKRKSKSKDFQASPSATHQGSAEKKNALRSKSAPPKRPKVRTSTPYRTTNKLDEEVSERLSRESSAPRKHKKDRHISSHKKTRHATPARRRNRTEELSASKHHQSARFKTTSATPHASHKSSSASDAEKLLAKARRLVQEGDLTAAVQVLNEPLPSPRHEMSPVGMSIDLHSGTRHEKANGMNSCSAHSRRRRRRTKTPLRRRSTKQLQPTKQPEHDDKSTSPASSSSSSSSEKSMSSFGCCADNDLNKSFVQLAVSGIEERIVQVERTPGSRSADVAILASQSPSPRSPDRLSRTFHSPRKDSDLKSIALLRSASMGHGLRSPTRAMATQSLSCSTHSRSSSHGRSKPSGRALAVAHAAVIDNAPPTPRSRNRVSDRRTLAEVNAGVPLHEGAGISRDNAHRGTAATAGPYANRAWTFQLKQ